MQRTNTVILSDMLWNENSNSVFGWKWSHFEFMSLIKRVEESRPAFILKPPVESICKRNTGPETSHVSDFGVFNSSVYYAWNRQTLRIVRI